MNTTQDSTPRALAAVLVLPILAFAGCGGGGSASHATASVSEPPPPGVVDLAFEDYHYHGGQESPFITIHFRVANHNSQGVTLSNIRWAMRDDGGAVVMSGTVPTLPAGAGMDIEQDYPGNTAGRHPYFFVLDPDNQIPETSETNNVAEIIPDAPSTGSPPPSANELVFLDPHVHHPSRTELTFHVTIANVGTSGNTLNNVAWRIRRDDGSVVRSGTIASLPAGTAAATANETIFSITESEGEHTYLWDIDPADAISDDGKANNHIRYIVVVSPAGSA